MLDSGRFIFVGGLELLRRTETQFEAITQPVQHKVDLLLIGVKPEFMGKLIHLQRGYCRDWTELNWRKQQS